MGKIVIKQQVGQLTIIIVATHEIQASAIDADIIHKDRPVKQQRATIEAQRASDTQRPVVGMKIHLPHLHIALQEISRATVIIHVNRVKHTVMVQRACPHLHLRPHRADRASSLKGEIVVKDTMMDMRLFAIKYGQRTTVRIL